jgi:hypothetical protein
VSLSVGLIPAVAPTFYQRFPANFQVIFGSSITSTVIIVFLLNLFFNHWTAWPPRNTALRVALGFGAVTGQPTTAGRVTASVTDEPARKPATDPPAVTPRPQSSP